MPDQELEERKDKPSEKAAPAPLRKRDQRANESVKHDNLAKTEPEAAESLDALATRLASGDDRQHDLFADDGTIKIDTRASSDLSVSEILNPPTVPPSGKLVKPDVSPQRNRIAEATNSISQITAMFTAPVGSLVEGLHTGSTIQAAHTAATLDRIRQTADYVNTVQANQIALIQAAGTVDLIAEFVHHGMIPAGTKPREALKIASLILADHAEIFKMMENKKKDLRQIQSEVLALDIKMWTQLSRASGALMLAPVTGVVGEAGAIPGVFLESLGVGLAHAAKETLKELGTIIPDFITSVFFDTVYAFFRAQDQINVRYLTPESTVGGLTLTAGMGLETWLLLSREELRNPAAVVGLFVLSLCAATSASLTTGMIRGTRSGKFTSEYENARRARANAPIPPQKEPVGEIIQGEKPVDVTDEKEKTGVKK